MKETLLIALILPFLATPLIAWLGSRAGARCGWMALPVPVVCFSLIASLLLGAEPFLARTVSVPWIPSMGLDLTFVIDGLSLFFGLVVSGMGILIVFYSTQYLDSHYRYHHRFYAYLMLFMGSMLGAVFSENLLLLFTFWELTGIASFLLIGFLHTKEGSRAGARMAFFTTTATGLAMLAGIVLLGETAGSYSVRTLMENGMREGGSPHLMTAAFVLMAIGAFGKSAQFPFQYWLPNAMAAPTPVSAYLHSATMVKLGVFFIARVFPIFSGLDAWAPLLVTIGFFTMLLGALMALLSHDLKGILAYSTVSQLGFLIGFYGIGSAEGVHYDLMHIANHVFYKGCLFMVAGIIDHSAGTRDIRLLGGLGRRMPLLTVIALIAAMTMAGLPGTLGFISKEYMLKEKFDYWAEGGWLAWYPVLLVVTASVIKMAFSLRFVFGVFAGSMPAPVAERFHAPGLLIQLPALLLAAACIVFGLLPGLMTPALQLLSAPGLQLEVVEALKLWHGLTREFVVSVAIVAAGAVLFLMMRRGWNQAQIPMGLRFDIGFEALVEALPGFAKKVTAFTRADRPVDYLPVVAGVIAVAFGGTVAWHWREIEAMLGPWTFAEAVDPLRAFVVALVALAVVAVLFLRRWTAQLIAIGIVGFLITFYFVLFRAPDLAMTQILVEAATLILVLLLLARFPASAERGEFAVRPSPHRQAFNVAVSVAVGLSVAAFTFSVAALKHPDNAGDYFLANSESLAKGTNAVNTILVDFRGFDTLLEVAVLLIAMLGALGLLMHYRRTRDEYEAGPMGPAGFGIESGKEEEP
jgi:NADH:ubiquinone oxidoreductase subunit 5 (subunit L)/multisubunit Na+/H+ antiporter MnhA subunit